MRSARHVPTGWLVWGNWQLLARCLLKIIIIITAILIYVSELGSNVSTYLVLFYFTISHSSFFFIVVYDAVSVVQQTLPTGFGPDAQVVGDSMAIV